MDRNLARGLFLGAVSLSFGLGALNYPVGNFAHAGPGLFPLMVSCLLFAVALATIVRSRYDKRVPIDFNVRNIGLLLFALCGFAVVSKVLNMVAGIAFMVFVGGIAASTYSWKRNLKIAAGLIAVAFAFQKLLGLSLPLL